MIFIFPITTPANTPATAKQKTILQLAAGTITHVEAQFPPGVNALAHIQITDGLHQLYPTNPEADVATGAETVLWNDSHELKPGSCQLYAYTWNEDDTFQHTITVRIEVREPAAGNVAAEIADLLSSQSQSG